MTNIRYKYRLNDFVLPRQCLAQLSITLANFLTIIDDYHVLYSLSVSPLSPSILLSFSLQLNKERELRKQLEELRSELLPLETQCQELMEKSTKRTTYLSWGLLAYMCAQAGFFARLTFVNYSWDLMEPITYFVTYTTSILCFAYFVITRQVSVCVCVS